jgi:hypothetical protein
LRCAGLAPLLLLLLLLWLHCLALVVLLLLTRISLWLLFWLLLCWWGSNTNEPGKGSPDACFAPVVSVACWLQAYAVVCCCWDEDAPQRIHQPRHICPAQHKRQHNKQHNMQTTRQQPQASPPHQTPLHHTQTNTLPADPAEPPIQHSPGLLLLAYALAPATPLHLCLPYWCPQMTPLA